MIEQPEVRPHALDDEQAREAGMVDRGGYAAPPRVIDYVHDFAARIPDEVAVVFDGRRLTYRELESQVVLLARALLARGIRRGDTVAVLSTPRTEFWITFLATTAIGAIWVGLNPKFTLGECRHVVGDARPRLLFSIADFEGRSYAATTATLVAEHDTLEEVVCLAGDLEGSRSYDDFLGLATYSDPLEYRTAMESVGRDEPALLVYTSGTSGKPKGALLSHHGLAFGAKIQVVNLALDRLSTMCSFPVNHVSSVADVCCVTLAAGGTLHFQERFDPGAVLACIERERITMWSGVPTMFLLVLDHPRVRDTDFSSVEHAICGGAALSETGMRRLRELAPRVSNVYGMTETAANIVFTGHDASVEVLCNTIGRPSELVECRIVSEDGEVCGVDEVGELQFRADFMFLGYLNRPEATRDAYTPDNWLKTGDLGFWRSDGNISLVGRRSEMFKSGGYNVYPREVELALEGHHAVAMAAVISVPDEVYQEVGAAYVVPKIGADGSPVEVLPEDLKQHCAQHLANYKVPKQFTISRELPTLPVGKIDKVALKKRLTSPGTGVVQIDSSSEENGSGET